METIWFYNGTKMQDGTLCSVGARSEAQVAEYIKDGCIAVDNYNDEFGKQVKKAKPKIVKKVVKENKSKVVKKSDEKNITKSKKD